MAFTAFSHPRMADAMLMLGLGISIALVVRGVSYGLNSVYRDTQVDEEEPPPQSNQGTEEGIDAADHLTTQSLNTASQDIPLVSLGMLATAHQNLEVRKAAIAILTNRFLSDTTNVRALLHDARQPTGSPHQRAAELAISMIRETHGVDLDEWDLPIRCDPARRRDPVRYARALWEVLPSEPDEHGSWEMQPSSLIPRDRPPLPPVNPADPYINDQVHHDLAPVHLTLPLLARNAPALDLSVDGVDDADGLYDDDYNEDDDDENDINGDDTLIEHHARLTRSLMTARRRRERSEEVARRRVRREAVVINNGDRPITQDDIFQRPSTGAAAAARSITIDPDELYF